MPNLLVSAALTLLPLLPASSQETPPATQVPASGWQLFDRVEMIVNEDIVTVRNLVREVAALQRKGQVAQSTDPRALEDEIRAKLVRRFLSVQAGENMGLEPGQVERQVRLFLGRETDHYDGVVGFADHLQSLDIDAADHRREVEEEIYSRFWTDYVTGEGPAPQSERISVDRYVRPGLLRFHHRTLVAQPSELTVIGGKPQTVTLQFLVVDPKRSGRDLDGARKLAIQLRERILDGEDLVVLNDQYGAARTSQTEPLEEERLRAAEPAIGAFVSTAAPGDVSEVMPYVFKGAEMWRIVRLVARDEAAVPDLATLEVQKRLAELYQENLAAYRRDSALSDVIRAAYVWPPRLARRPEKPTTTTDAAP